jgi:hypothetical protein
MDELDTGALAVDAGGIVRAANRLARSYLGIGTDARGKALEQALPDAVRERVLPALAHEDGGYQELDLPVGRGVRLRVHARALAGPDGGALGRVILAREISHEPARRKLDAVVEGLVNADGPLRERLAAAQHELAGLVRELGETGVTSPGRAELRDRAMRTQTAIEYWLAVDDALAREAFPDAQPLVDRMRLAGQRWPQQRLPERVRELARRVESYYESGENPKQPVL